MDHTTTLTPVVAAPGEPGPDLRAQVLEQVMRLSGDDLLPLTFLTADAGSPDAAAALGRLLQAHPVRLVDRCPLVAFTTGRPLDPQWREWCPPRPDSLWEALLAYRLLYQTCAVNPAVEGDAAPDALAELEHLRSLAGGAAA